MQCQLYMDSEKESANRNHTAADNIELARCLFQNYSKFSM